MRRSKSKYSAKGCRDPHTSSRIRTYTNIDDSYINGRCRNNVPCQVPKGHHKQFSSHCKKQPKYNYENRRVGKEFFFWINLLQWPARWRRNKVHLIKSKKDKVFTTKSQHIFNNIEWEMCSGYLDLLIMEKKENTRVKIQRIKALRLNTSNWVWL